LLLARRRADGAEGSTLLMGFPSIGVAARICARESLFYQHKIAQPISKQAKYLWNYRSLCSKNSWEGNNSRAEFLFPKKNKITQLAGNQICGIERNPKIATILRLSAEP
jgi:hypothetical protein